MEPDVLSEGTRTQRVAKVAVETRLPERDFVAAYEAHYCDVYRYVLALTRSHADAEDTCSETFERAYREWAQRGVAPGQMLPWLLLTARRIATDRWRRARHFTRLLPGLRPSTELTSELGQTEFWLWFDALCEVLPDRQREVLVLRHQRDLSDADIGIVMGLTGSGLRSLVARAIANLRDHPELLS